MLTEIQRIAMDLDDTLLHTDKTISPHTLRVLGQCRARGIQLIVATARSEQGAEPFLGQIRPDAVISCGGARTARGGVELFSYLIPAPLADRLIRAFLDDPEVGVITVETRDGYCSNDRETVLLPGFSHCRYNDFSALPHCDAYKITVEIFTDAARGRMERQFPECGVVGYKGEDWYRFAMPEATKQGALHRLCALDAVPMEAVAAFGDDLNDVGMISACGCGVAMGNAIGQAKACARYITGTNDDDGVARFLERYILL